MDSPPFAFSASFQLTSSRRGWPGRCMAISNVLLFQLTSSRRGWPVCLEDLTEEQIFQLTSSRRGWPDPRSLPVLTLSFQLTSSRRGWRPTICHQRWAINNFNSHPHEEDDLQSVIPFGNVEIFQLTSSRRGWHLVCPRIPLVYHISTHILTKRMTRFSDHLPLYRSYFNSHPHEEDDDASCQSLGDIESFQLTSSRRGWDTRVSTTSTICIFQLTSSRRGWRCFLPVLRWHRVISTHILTKRMTSGISSFIPDGTTFQLTSSRRGWPLLFVLSQHWNIFQLTSSRRGWQFLLCFYTHCVLFQLTSSRRGWLAAIQEFSAKEFISTHILTKRMTSFSYSLFRLSTISTHILTKRMTVSNGTQGEKRKYFNSHPHEEDDNVWFSFRNSVLYFNSHPHEEDDFV